MSLETSPKPKVTPQPHPPRDRRLLSEVHYRPRTVDLHSWTGQRLLILENVVKHYIWLNARYCYHNSVCLSVRPVCHTGDWRLNDSIFIRFNYPNVTTLRLGLCYGNSVSSVVCLSSVTLVHTTQAVESSGHISLPLCTLPSSDLLTKFYGDRPKGTPPSDALHARGVAK